MVPSNHTEQHTLIALVEDKPGVLTRVASMFRRRGFNIASLAVGNSEQPGLSRMTFVVNGDDYTVSQVAKQLDKLIDVIEVSDITSESTVTRELALIKVKTNQMTRGEIIQIVNLFRANIIDVSAASRWSSKSPEKRTRLTPCTTCCRPSASSKCCGPVWWRWFGGKPTGWPTDTLSKPVR